MTLDKVKLKTINNQSVIGDGNISVGGSSVDIVTSWSSTTSDSKVPSEKLVKDSLDGKANSSHTHTKSQITDFPTLSTVATSGSYNDLSNKPSIPSATSDLTNDSGFITSSSLPTKTSDLTNDGSDGTNAFVSTNDSRLYDTGWQDITPNTNFSHYSNGQKAQYRRIGKVVALRGALKNTNAFTPSSDTSNKIGTISDSTCKPSMNILTIEQGSGQNRFLLTVDENGYLYVSRYGTTSGGQVGSGAWLNVNTTYFVD